MSHSLKLGLTVATLATLDLSAANPAAAQSKIYNFQATAYSNGNSTTYTGTGVLGNGVSSTSIFNREDYVGNNVSQVGGTAMKVGTNTFTSFGTVVGSNNVGNTNLVFQYDATDYSYTTPGTGITGSDQYLMTGFQTTTGTGHISLTGLAPNTPFTVVFYAENGKYADGIRTTFTLTDSSHVALSGAKNTSTSTASSGTAFMAPSVNVPGNYVKFTGTADKSGGIYATYAGNGAVGVFNGAQFQVSNAVPGVHK